MLNISVLQCVADVLNSGLLICVLQCVADVSVLQCVADVSVLQCVADVLNSGLLDVLNQMC